MGLSWCNLIFFIDVASCDIVHDVETTGMAYAKF